MVDARLKTKVWIHAFLHRCTLQGAYAAVAVPGDPDAGSVLLKVNTLGTGFYVLTRVRKLDGQQAWLRATGKDLVAETEADAYITRQQTYDADLWVIEIESRTGLVPIDEAEITQFPT